MKKTATARKLEDGRAQALRVCQRLLDRSIPMNTLMALAGEALRAEERRVKRYNAYRELQDRNDRRRQRARAREERRKKEGLRIRGRILALHVKVSKYLKAWYPKTHWGTRTYHERYLASVGTSLVAETPVGAFNMRMMEDLHRKFGGRLNPNATREKWSGFYCNSRTTRQKVYRLTLRRA